VVSPTKNHALVTMVEIEIEANATAVQDLTADYNGFIFVLEGSGTFGSHHTKAQKGQVLLLYAIQGDATASEIRIQAKEKMKVIFLAGLPLRELVVAKGPFVMNTEEEIKQAYAD
jgi:redox-sensitive bicupin YhaK (pirin superfamily)